MIRTGFFKAPEAEACSDAALVFDPFPLMDPARVDYAGCTRSGSALKATESLPRLELVQRSLRDVICVLTDFVCSEEVVASLYNSLARVRLVKSDLNNLAFTWQAV